jgi:intracellular protein transport protein USO1
LLEALLVVKMIVAQSADIQKVFAFEGIFDRLFGIITNEHGLDGGLVVRDTLLCIDTLLRFNSSNQVHLYAFNL